MRDANEPTWWLRTAEFGALTIALVGVLVLVPLIVPALFGGESLLGLPLATFLAVVGGPLVILIAIFVFARRQLARDRRYDVAEH